MAWNFSNLFSIVSWQLCTRHLQLFENHLRTKLGMSMMKIDVGRRVLTLKSDLTVNIEWEKVRESFIIICDILQKLADYVAPLVLFCYVAYIYEIVVAVC